MRAFLVGTLLLLFASAAFAQQDISGGVESIGFDQNYRPDCWTPMLVNLSSKNDATADYEIQVEQEDIDGDTVVYSRTVTLNAGKQEKYWVYFLPTTRGYKSSNTRNVNELKRELRVNLYTMGGKFVCNIPLTPGAGMSNLDPKRNGGMSDAGPDKKLVLVVGADAGSASWREYVDSIGLIEDVVFVPVRTADLPESPLGFEAVDAILWLNANGNDLTVGGSHKLQAIDQWVAKGGDLVVCQTQVIGWLDAFAELLPIQMKTEAGDSAVKWVDCEEPEPLYRILRQAAGTRLPNSMDFWKSLPKGKYQVARASAKPGALVEEWVDWDDANPSTKPATPPASKTTTRPTTKPSNRSPYIVRLGHGAGAVTWVGQDLSSPAITNNRLQGWPYIWDTIFGWKNETRTKAFVDMKAALGDRSVEAAYAPAAGVNIGASARGDSKFDSKAGAYVALAILFFIGYWVVAGPGGYVVLASKGRRHISWQIFAVCAILATALTVGVVKLVLRGEPEVKHFTVVRMAEGKPTVINSRIGLYIPRDGPQEIKLTGGSPTEVSTIHAVAEQPEAVADREGFTDTGKYTIPVHDNTDNGEVSIRVPFRSTLKRMQAQWVGDMPFAVGVVGNRPAVVPPVDLSTPGKPLKRGTIRGKVTNNTGAPLHNVFFAFRHERSQDYILFVPTWDKAETLDLELAYNDAKRLIPGMETPIFNRSYSGLISSQQWGGFWHGGLRPSALAVGTANNIDDSTRGVRIYLAMMSVFDRVSPARVENIDGNLTPRGDVLRRGGRSLDLSAALTSGDLLILAESGSAANPVPLPFPLEVESEKVTGNGTVYYQFVMPLDRSALIDNESALGDVPAEPS